MMKNSAFPFFILATSTENIERAWELFKDELEHYFSFIGGHKYWRSVPKPTTERDFATDETEYRITARIFAVHEPLNDIPEINLLQPYPEKSCCEAFEVNAQLEGFKLGNRGNSNED